MKKGLLIAFLVLAIVSGCSVLPGLSPTGESIEITDTTGHVVILDGVPERIAIAGRATIMVQDAVYLFDDAIQKVIALENRKQSAFSFLPVVDQGIYDKEMFEMNAGPEQIAVAQSDLVILKSFMAEKLGEPLEQLSIPVIYLNLETPEVFYQDIVVLGQVFGKPDRAEEINNFYQDRVTRVEELVSGVEPDQMPEVLILEYSDSGGSITSGWRFNHRMLTAAPNAAPWETPKNPGSTRGFLKTICSTEPAAARTIPSSSAVSKRGRRKFKTNCCANWS